MTKIDPEQERLRLADFYSRQLDGRLEVVAGQAYELTEMAREMLRAELSRRGLSTELVEQAPVPPPRPVLPGDPPPERSPVVSTTEGEPELPGMVTIRQFRDLPEALLAKGSLESAGIECALGDDNMVRLDWFYSNAIGGIKLLVSAEDAESAEQVLSQPIPEHFDVSGIGEYEQPRCPQCNSLDINFRESDPSAYLSMAVIAPIPFRRRAWRCHSCNVEWEDDGLPGPDESSA